MYRYPHDSRTFHILKLSSMVVYLQLYVLALRGLYDLQATAGEQGERTVSVRDPVQHPPAPHARAACAPLSPVPLPRPARPLDLLVLLSCQLYPIYPPPPYAHWKR